MRADKDSQRVLLKALTDHGNSYRQGMRPADIIQQSLIERRECAPNKPVKPAGLLEKLVRPKSKR